MEHLHGGSGDDAGMAQAQVRVQAAQGALRENKRNNGPHDTNSNDWELRLGIDPCFF
jgi:hypothetical protein